MWVIFLLSVLAFSIIAIAVAWTGNKAYLSMKRDEAKTKKKIEKENMEE